MKTPLLSEEHRFGMSDSMDQSLIAAGTMETRIMDNDPLLERNHRPPTSLQIMKAPVLTGFKSFRSGLGDNFGRGIYVLFVLTITFMLAQISMWLLAVTAANMQHAQHWGSPEGTSPQYDFLAGPVFTVMTIVAILPVGYITDKQWISRERFLALACFVWSGGMVLTGNSDQYWQVVMFRMVIAISTSAAQPLSASILSDFFPSQIRASAMAIFNSGIYVGFSIAYGLGNFMSEHYSWRWAWYIFGFIGGAISLLTFCLPSYKPPINTFAEIPSVETQTLMTRGRFGRKRRHKVMDSEADVPFEETESVGDHRSDSEDTEIDVVEPRSNVSISSVLAYYLKTPSLILLLIASTYRNTGGYVWGYQAQNFLQNEKGQSGEDIAKWLGWIPAVSGSIGCLLGAALSDRLAALYGKGDSNEQFVRSTVTVRIWVLVFASLISGPMAAGVLLLDPPYNYWSLFSMYFFSECWVAITTTVVIDLSPEHMKSTLLSVYYFFIAFGGLSPQLVTPLANEVGYFWCIMLLWPVCYASVALLFFAVIFTYKRDLQKSRVTTE